MSVTAKLITQILSVLTVGGDILILFLLAIFIVYAFRKKGGKDFSLGRGVIKFFGKNAIFFSFVIAVSALVGSLYYSEIVGFEPCKLCWIQRIFIYPQALILGLALKRKDERIADYSIILSAAGGVFSGYHQYLQFGGRSLFSCSSGLNAVSCVQRLTLEFGYVTLPMMMLTGFILIIIFMAAQKKWFWDEKF